MAEYIKREEAIDVVTEVYYDTPDVNLSPGKFEMAIDGIPAADVASVVHGCWERRFCHPMRDGEWQYICSVCKNDNYWRNNVCHQKHRYCPNCGAKMDGVDNNG